MNMYRLFLLLCFGGISLGERNNLTEVNYEDKTISTDNFDTNSVNKMFEHLNKRMNDLESKDIVNQHKIADMNSKIEYMAAQNQQDILTLNRKIQSLEERSNVNERETKELNNALLSNEASYKLKERELQIIISELKSKCDIIKVTNNNKNLKKHGVSTINETNVENFTNETVDKENRALPMTEYRIRRGEPETEVAFFATVTPHDVDNLGSGQNIVFDNAVTNLGNAYHHVHGIFTAPVAGTYVFYVTVAARVATSRDGYFYARVDVNGVARANILCTPVNQASQLVIVQLNAGDDVSIKNSHLGDGLLGSGWSSFSGFLLFQSYSGSSSVVG